MKSMFIPFNRLLLVALLVLAGCSFRVNHPVVSQETPVARENAIIVMGVTWVEKYNDTEDGTERKLFSYDLIKDKKRVRKRLRDPNGTAITKPLHYLSNFEFQFDGPQEGKHGFIRFKNDIKEYEEIAIHQFVPGHVRLNNIAFNQRHFSSLDLTKNREFRWVLNTSEFEEDYGSWDLQAGKIIYLGHLTLYFKSRRFIFGLITPEELVHPTKLVAVVIEDRFDEVKQQLKREKSWFPADEIVNQAKPAKWIYAEKLFAEFNQAPGVELKRKKEPVRKRDKKKFFF
jgi:hypothetical protein